MATETNDNRFPTVLNAGADAVLVQFAKTISVAANQRVTALQRQLRQSALPLTDVVPAYSSLMIYYDVTQLAEPALRDALTPMLNELDDTTDDQSGELHTVEVYYGDEVGPDMHRVMSQHNLSKEQVIEKHTAEPYRVFAIGFAPGFAYMGVVAEDLATPRLDRPRESIPTGSVALAEKQTAIYPVNTPGGWNIIGRTATPLYQPEQGILSKFEVGDHVQFKAITKDQFIEAGGDPEARND